ncbi:MAG: zinc ribbon domain-containing protein [Clostridia bacterium]|nr:zinc ribbon domain-containing protein [Clostridia bacterium]
MYCQYCGKIIDDYATVCSKCGAHVANPKVRPVAQKQMPYPTYQQAQAQQAQAQQTQAQQAQAWQTQAQQAQAWQAQAPQAQDEVQPAAEEAVQENTRRNGFGVAGFTLSIFSIVLGPVIIFNLLGIIFSAIGVAKRPNYGRRNGLAVAGLVISIVFLVIWVVAIVLAFMYAQDMGWIDMLADVETWEDFTLWVQMIFDSLKEGAEEGAVMMALI